MDFYSNEVIKCQKLKCQFQSNVNLADQIKISEECLLSHYSAVFHGMASRYVIQITKKKYQLISPCSPRNPSTKKKIPILIHQITC